MAHQKQQRADTAVSSHERVCDWVRDGLYSGRFVPGQKLIEIDLMNALDISRGPIREGLKRLHGQGIVELRPNRGALVKAFTFQEAHDLLVVVEPLTALMAQLAAEAVANGASSEDLADLQAWIARFREGEFAEGAFVGQRHYFYRTLMTLGGNTGLVKIMPTESLHLLRLQTFYFLNEADRQDITAEYVTIIDAVLAGDEKRASRAGIAHVRAAKKRLSRLPTHIFPENQAAGR